MSALVGNLETIEGSNQLMFQPRYAQKIVSVSTSNKGTDEPMHEDKHIEDFVIRNIDEDASQYNEFLPIRLRYCPSSLNDPFREVLPMQCQLIFLSFYVCLVVCEPQHDRTNKMTCAPSVDSDQPEHPLSLIRFFNVRMMKQLVLSYP